MTKYITKTLTILSPPEVRNGTIRRSRKDKRPPGRQDDSETETDELIAGWKVVINSGYTTTTTTSDQFIYYYYYYLYLGSFA